MSMAGDMTYVGPSDYLHTTKYVPVYAPVASLAYLPMKYAHKIVLQSK